MFIDLIRYISIFFLSEKHLFELKFILFNKNNFTNAIFSEIFKINSNIGLGVIQNNLNCKNLKNYKKEVVVFE